MLFLHWEGDQRCPVGQSEEMYVSLKRQGKHAQFVRFPGGAHASIVGGQPSHQVEYVERLVAFVIRWVLQQRAQEPTAAAVGG
jgi:dipeptidyl aminopeptidase/acylaminoacyl peptidase